MFSILLGTRSNFRTFSSQLISKNLPKYNGLHINKHFAEPLVLHPTSPRQALGSIIWLPGEHLTHENFAQLWFIEMKPKYCRMVIPSVPLRSLHDDKFEKHCWFYQSGCFLPGQDLDIDNNEQIEEVCSKDNSLLCFDFLIIFSTPKIEFELCKLFN